MNRLVPTNEAQDRLYDEIAFWIARHLPQRVKYWAYINVAAKATIGPLADREVPSVTMIEVLRETSKT